MKCNLHTHTVFCDGVNTPEEMVMSAIDKGLVSFGFSGHGYTSFDFSYCMKNTEEYINEVLRLKEKFKDKIQVYLGLEEESLEYCDRSQFDYIIGSSHYYCADGKLFDVDNDVEIAKSAVEAFGNNPVAAAESYYEKFCDYILKRKPDIVGHFDLLTKFDEKYDSIFTGNKEYEAVAEKYLLCAIKSGCLFEVNTGAISRGYKTRPYPSDKLLHILCKNDVGVVITSDCHSAQGIDCFYDETENILKDVGFKYTYMLLDNEFKRVDL